MFLRGVSALSLTAMIACASAYPAQPPPPAHIPGATTVDAESLINLAQGVPRLVLIDARLKVDRKQGYIEGAASLPDVDTNCRSLRTLIPHRSTPVLFYCNGVKCWRSEHSVKAALACGYTNVYWFRGGFEEWKQKGYPYLKE